MTYYFIWDKKEKKYINFFFKQKKIIDKHAKVFNLRYERGRFKVVALELPDGG